MLVIGLGIGMIVAGIVAMVRGRLQLTNSRAVQGVWVYLLGVALISALPLGFFAAMVYMLMNVDPNKPDDMDRWGKEHELTLSLIIAAVEIGIGLVVFILGASMAKPFSTAGRRFATRDREYDDEYEGRSRRRRPDDEYEEDNRPRRRRPDDFEGRPRRDDLDERAQ
jgi:dipeptide/tripeptide permease